ncbi:MAG: transketolase [Chloroflexota bacterium]|jgi:transketolase|nr:transketolase [Chloroflexota bacterium]
MNGPQVRRLVLERCFQAGVGHIGSALSVSDILAVLCDGAVRGIGSDDPDRDLLILSKGHAAVALYAALHLGGHLSAHQLATYCGDGSLLGVHPEHQLPGIDFSTGSLGHGLSFGAGAALGMKRRGVDGRVFVVVSDAELNEGLVWEAAMFAAHQRLDNLVAVLDDNGQQALGHTDDVLKLRPLRPRFEAAGWAVDEVDGHDPEALRQALHGGDDGRPRVVIAATIAGHGVSFMEGRVSWHYLPMDADQYARALAEVGG